jgi:hypothetical protein
MTIPELRRIYQLLLLGAHNARLLDKFEESQEFSDTAQKVSNELDSKEGRS